MKLLIQNKDMTLEWKDVIYKNGTFMPEDESKHYDQNDIFAIKDDDRNKTVVCAACGKEVKNTPASIKAHRNMINNPNKCFDCGDLRTRDAKTTSQKYVLNDDGTYNDTTKRVVRLVCGNGWRYPDINSDDAKSVCKYSRCENTTFKSIEDFWTKHPGAFDEFITIDRLIDAGYKSVWKTGNEVIFEIKCRSNLKAVVNNQGLCIFFELRHRHQFYTLRYSKMYDKAWVVNSYSFKDLNRLDIGETTINSIMNKLRNLYQ